MCAFIYYPLKQCVRIPLCMWRVLGKSWVHLDVESCADNLQLMLLTGACICGFLFSHNCTRWQWRWKGFSGVLPREAAKPDGCRYKFWPSSLCCQSLVIYLLSCTGQGERIACDSGWRGNLGCNYVPKQRDSAWWAGSSEVCEDELQWDMRVPGKGLLKGVFSFFFFLAFDSSTTCDFC